MVAGFNIKVDIRRISFADDDVSASLARIYRLKRSIESYDKNWELIQIFTPNENAQHIQVLYRKRVDQA